MDTDLSYVHAIRLFDEVKKTLKRPDANPELWNLSIGLSRLAEALQQDMAELKKILKAIDSDVKSIR